MLLGLRTAAANLPSQPQCQLPRVSWLLKEPGDLEALRLGMAWAPPSVSSAHPLPERLGPESLSEGTILTAESLSFSIAPCSLLLSPR